jgi:AcrR family transcriptional regulator
MIIDASLKLLARHSVEEFTLAQVAKRLDTVSMALYNYFPSREALLAEVANHIGKQFTMPPPRPGQDWKATLRDWLWTLRALGEKYPVLFRIAGIEGKTSAGWLRIIRVPGTVLHELGFRGKELALTYWQFCLKAHALVQAEITDAGFHAPVSLSRLEELDPDEQAHFLMLRPFQGQITDEDIMEEGFADLVDAIERKLEAKTRRRGRSVAG